LEADATAGGLIPKRPRRSCTLKSGKSRLLWIHVVCMLSKSKSRSWIAVIQNTDVEDPEEEKEDTLFSISR
jgi:hypothetical protein